MEGLRHIRNRNKQQKEVAPSQPSSTPPAPQTLSPKQGAEAMVESGLNRHSQRLDVLFLKAVWGGIFLSYGGMFTSVVAGSTWEMQNNAGILRMLEAIVFPVGLTMIVLSGVELVTSDMMFMFLAALKGRIPWWGVAVNYFVVFWGNLAGSLFFSHILIYYAGLVNSPAIRSFIVNAAESRSGAQWHQLFLRGIGCNIMVCMSVYLASQASDLLSKAVGVWIPLSTFVIIQFEHVVADMFTIPLGIKLGANVSVARYIGTPLMASLIGNIVGAWALGLSLYWFYLHDTTSSPPFVHSKRNDPHADVEHEAESRDSDGATHVGPLGEGTFGHPTKIQGLWSSNGYDKHHF